MIPESYIRVNMLSNELVRCSVLCLHNIMEAEEASPSAWASGPLARPRLPRHVVLAIGGCRHTGLMDAIEVFDPSARAWGQLRARLKHPRSYHGTAYLDGSVYCLGGLNMRELNTVHRLDLSTCTWSEVSPMHSRRSCLSVAVLNGCIYAMGGSDHHRFHCTAERYTPESNQWSLIARMNQRRSGACSTVFNGRVGETSSEFLCQTHFKGRV